MSGNAETSSVDHTMQHAILADEIMEQRAADMRA
jgi:hypothetical protein